MEKTHLQVTKLGFLMEQLLVLFAFLLEVERGIQWLLNNCL